MPKRKRPKSYFRIGPGGAMYVIITALILAVAIYAQANLLFWSFGLMVGGLVVSIAVSWLMMRGIEVQRLLPQHAVADEAAVLRYLISNRKGFLPSFGLVISETWGGAWGGWKRTGPIADRRLKARPYGWVLHVGPGQSVQAEAPCWPLRRGVLGFERIAVSTSFPFGVVRRVIEVEQPGQMLVYPRLFRMNRRTLYRLSQADPSGRKHIDRSGGTEEFFGLRDYRAGDSLKMIDWKRTARTGDLVTRELTQPSPPRIMIALDLSELPKPAPNGNGKRKKKHAEPERDPFDDVERAVSLTASLVCDAHFNGYQTGLVVLGVECMPFPIHHSLPHRTKMLEALSMLDLTSQADRERAVPARPSVVVTPGRGGPGGAHNQTLLGAANLEEYVIENDAGSSALLSTRAGPRSRRDQIREGEA